MTAREEKTAALKAYFQKRDDVALAFLFGSQAKGYARSASDWDIGIYFRSSSGDALELESESEYPEAHGIWRDVEQIVAAPVDLVVLNRAAPPLVFSIINQGAPLSVKDRGLYLELLSKTHYEAVDFQGFIQEFWRIRERSRSLSPEDRSRLFKHLIFLENELQDAKYFKTVTQQQYMEDRAIKRNVERWVENVIMASLDIGKTILSSERKNVPDSYRETLRTVGLLYFNEEFAQAFSEFAELRNLVAHEYLDLRWKRIVRFIQEADRLYPLFLERIKEIAEA